MKTCLVVDDSSVIRKVARRILEGLDFQIVEAEDGEQALEACRKRFCSTGTCRRWTAMTSFVRCGGCRAATVRKWCSAPPRTTLRISPAHCTPAPTNTS